MRYLRLELELPSVWMSKLRREKGKVEEAFGKRMKASLLLSKMSNKELSLVSHRIVSNYLRCNGFHQTLDCFRQESLNTDEIDSTADINLDLENLILKHLKSDPNYSNISCNKPQIKDRQSDSDRLLSSLSSDFYSLKGPSTLPYKLQNTFNSLHTNNILSIKILHFPIRSFNSNPDSDSDSEVEPLAFKIHLKKCLVTTAADKTIVFFHPQNGQVIESLEGNGQPRSEQEEGEGEVVRGHSSAVLAVEQNPTRKREMVSCGMDAKIVFWDLVSSSCQTRSTIKGKEGERESYNRRIVRLYVLNSKLNLKSLSILDFSCLFLYLNSYSGGLSSLSIITPSSSSPSNSLRLENT